MSKYLVLSFATITLACGDAATTTPDTALLDAASHDASWRSDGGSSRDSGALLDAFVPTDATTSTTRYPHQPAGMVPLAELDGSAPPTEPSVGWNWFLDESSWGFDATALSPPVSPPTTLRYGFPAGTINGSGGGTVAFTIPPGVVRVYLSAHVRWGDPWRMHPGGAKFWFFRSPSGAADRILALWPAGDPERDPGIFGFLEPWPEPTGGPTIERGVWHHIEVVAVAHSGSSSDGVLRAWIDGELAVDAAGFRWWGEADSFGEILYDSTQGGGMDTFPTAQHYDTDHVFVSISSSRD